MHPLAPSPPAVDDPAAPRLVLRDEAIPSAQQHRENNDERSRETGQGNSHSLLRERPSQKSRPAPSLITRQPHVRHYLRNVDRKLVRRRIHAGVIAGTAVVTEMSDVENVTFRERPAHLERGKDRAVAFAIATGIADRQLAFGFFEKITPEH